jgi:tetratricopeptide (TPR) repeat protein
MSKKRKIIFSVSGLVILIALSVFAVTFITDNPLRKKLPKHPAYSTLSKTLSEQIKTANFISYLHPTANNIGNLGMVYHSGVLYDNAILCYQLAAETSKRDWIWSYYLGYLNLELGDAKASIENFKHVTERNPRNYMALFYTGQAYQNLGYLPIAKNIYKRIASSNDADAGSKRPIRENYFSLQTYAMYNLGRIYLNSNRLDSAEIVLREIIKKQWTFGPAYRLLGNVYTKGGDTIQGKKFITRANDLDEYTPPPDSLIDKIALISRSDQFLLKQIDDARMTYNFNWDLELATHALKYIPDNKYLLSNTIVLYFILGRNKDVLPLLDKHFKLFNDDFEELMKLADLLHGKGIESQAMQYFEQAKKVQPGSSRLALWLLSIGKKNEAVNLINEQLKKEPDNERILTDAVDIYLNIGAKDKASTTLTHLQKLYPSSLEAKKATGLLLEMDGKKKEAIAVYEEITKDSRKDLSIIKYLATIYLQDKMWKEAINNFRSGLEKYPNEPALLEPLGRLLISCPDTKLRNIAEGREYSERAYIHYKCPPEIRILAARNLATAYAIMGDKQMASRYINTTLNMVQRGNVPLQDYISYFDVLKKQYNLTN